MKTQNTKSILLSASLSASMLFLVACSPSDEASTTADTSATTAALLLSETPTEAVSVYEARKQAQPGATIQVSGQIGGTLKPFIEGYAGFVLADPQLDFCNEMGDDEHCSTPWDACCEDPDKLQSMRVSVQFVDSNGNPIQADLKQNLGIQELDEVTVVGTVADSSTASNTIIHATGLYK